MLCINPGHELDKIYKEWKDIDSVIVFGLGIWCRLYLSEIRQDIKISRILDNNPALQGKEYQGIPIISFEEYQENYHDIKIVISVYYKEISKQLMAAGLKENKDFCEMNLFVSMWYWFQKKKLHFTRVNTAITTKCTLNCKHCNMFMPFYKEPQHIPYKELCYDFDLLFGLVDKVYAVSLLGGEPFLHPQVDKLIHYIAGNYGSRIAELSFITNGTVKLKKSTLELLKKYGLWIQISDYTPIVPYLEKLENLKKELEQYGIPYRIVNSDSWLDFGFPVNSWDLDKIGAQEHFMDCYPLFRGLNDRKFYFCHVCWSAEKAGLFQNTTEDYIELEKIKPSKESKLRLLEYNLGFLEKGYMELCKKCGGCASKNIKSVPAGEQTKKMEWRKKNE